MEIVPIRIPQIGEGLQEARIVAFLKQPGDHVKRDEPIYQMETDKAVMDVESPNEGTLLKWLAAVDQVVAIGSVIAEIGSGVTGEVAAPVVEQESTRVVIPPRTRAYAKEKGLSDEDLNKLASTKDKLMPTDIDEYLGGAETAAAPKAAQNGRAFEDIAVTSKQRILNSRLTRANQLVVPGTITVAVDWEGIDRERCRVKKSDGLFKPSSFTMFAFGVAQAVREHPKLRTSLIGENTYRTYSTLSLGVAVALPQDELALAVVENADQLTWPEFATQLKAQIDLAREGKDQAHEAVTLSLTNMQNFGLRDAVPVVVPPACATLFLGETYRSAHEEESALVSRSTANLALTFDHRVMNGVGAAQFMSAVRKNVEHIERLLAL